MNEEIQVTEVNENFKEYAEQEETQKSSYSKEAGTEKVSGEQTENVLDKILDIWERVRLCCYFVPIITTVALIIDFIFELSDFAENYIIWPMVIIGWAAAVLTGPFRLIKLIWKWISFGWKAFWIIPVYPICLILGCMGAVLCFAGIGYILLFAPAVVTIYYFVTEEIY